MASHEFAKDKEDENDFIGEETLKKLEKCKNFFAIWFFSYTFCFVLDYMLQNPTKSALTPYSQLRVWKFSDEDIEKCRQLHASPFATASEYFKQTEKWQQIKFGVESLDSLTDGGIDVGSATEIFGEAGSGKTQLCMQLALNCQLPAEHKGLNGKVVYVSCDKLLPLKRLAAMADGLKVKFKDDPAVQEIKFLDNIFINRASTYSLMQYVMNNELPSLLRNHPDIRLFIIDSIAGMFRFDDDYIQRAEEMRNVIQELERLADIYNFAILITNQISAGSSFEDPQDDAALGPTFDSLIVTKLKVEKYQEPVEGGCCVRNMKVIYSPRLPCRDAKFGIGPLGIKD